MTSANKKVINKWINIFKLHEWQISCEFSDELECHEDARTYIDSVNRNAMVFIKKTSDFEECVIHEFLHLLLADVQHNFELIVDEKNHFMQQKVINDIESFVTKMERVITGDLNEKNS